MARLGKEPEFRDGLRVTDAETLDIARMVLVGQGQPRHRRRPSTCTARWRSACRARTPGSSWPAPATPSSASSATSTAVNPAILERLLAEDLIPVVSTIGSDAAGQAYNINADTVAGAVAEALGAEKLVYLTDVEGLLARRRRPRLA